MYSFYFAHGGPSIKIKSTYFYYLEFYVYDTVNAAGTRDAISWISGSGNPTIIRVRLPDFTRPRDTPVEL